MYVMNGKALGGILTLQMGVVKCKWKIDGKKKKRNWNTGN